jgi:hypothetical protein
MMPPIVHGMLRQSYGLWTRQAAGGIEDAKE